MPEAALTYGQLDETLRSLGFTARSLATEARIYKHEPTGATVIFPDTSLNETVIPHHLIVVRTVLKDFGILEPMDLA